MIEDMVAEVFESIIFDTLEWQKLKQSISFCFAAL